MENINSVHDPEGSGSNNNLRGLEAIMPGLQALNEQLEPIHSDYSDIPSLKANHLIPGTVRRVWNFIWDKQYEVFQAPLKAVVERQAALYTYGSEADKENATKLLHCVLKLDYFGFTNIERGRKNSQLGGVLAPALLAACGGEVSVVITEPSPTAIVIEAPEEVVVISTARSSGAMQPSEVAVAEPIYDMHVLAFPLSDELLERPELAGSTNLFGITTIDNTGNKTSETQYFASAGPDNLSIIGTNDDFSTITITPLSVFENHTIVDSEAGASFSGKLFSISETVGPGLFVYSGANADGSEFFSVWYRGNDNAFYLIDPETLDVETYERIKGIVAKPAEPESTGTLEPTNTATATAQPTATEIPTQPPTPEPTLIPFFTEMGLPQTVEEAVVISSLEDWTKLVAAERAYYESLELNETLKAPEIIAEMTNRNFVHVKIGAQLGRNEGITPVSLSKVILNENGEDYLFVFGASIKVEDSFVIGHIPIGGRLSGIEASPWVSTSTRSDTFHQTPQEILDRLKEHGVSLLVLYPDLPYSNGNLTSQEVLYFNYIKTLGDENPRLLISHEDGSYSFNTSRGIENIILPTHWLILDQ